MKTIPIGLGVCLILSTLTVACSSTLASPTPYPTYTPYPEPTPYPTYTPHPKPTLFPTYTPYPTPRAQASGIIDLFCEYDFCIGHPSDLHLREVSSLDEVEEWSTYRSGVLVGILDDRMVVKWRVSTKATWDTSLKAKEILLDDYLSVGNVTEETIGDSTVAYVQVKNKKSDELFPNGVSAAWYCGDRGFRLLINTEQEGSAVMLLKSSLERFTCAK